tara:strand:- start:12949 stop:14781 length:1833 start_codon:yes stop_codon:yes gene_type:complete
MTYNPFEFISHSAEAKAASNAENMKDVLNWLDSDDCDLALTVRRTYSQAVKKEVRLLSRSADRIPACSMYFQSEFPNRNYERSWGKTFSAAKRWKRNVSAAINGATGLIAEHRARRSRQDSWSSFQHVFKEIYTSGSKPTLISNPKQLISVQSCADTARKLNLETSEIDSELALQLYHSAPTAGAKESVEKTFELLDKARSSKDPRVQGLLPVQPICFEKPARANAVEIPERLMHELNTWVELASRGRWSITDNRYTNGISHQPFISAVKKVLTTAELAGAVSLAELDTIAAVFNKNVLVSVVRKLRDLDRDREDGAITPRTARGYIENLVPFLERNGEDASTVRSILDTDTWLKAGARRKGEMVPHVRSFCESVVKDMNARLRFLSLHIQFRKKASFHLRAAQKTTGRETEHHLQKARRYGTCAAFAALETDAVPARVSNILALTYRGKSPWLFLGTGKSDNGRMSIPGAFVKNRKGIHAVIQAASPFRGLETMRWFETKIRPLFCNHKDNDHFFPAVIDPTKPLPYGTFKSWWSDCAANSGFPGMNPHMFRHGQASILVAQNPGNWSLVSARLGDTEAVCRTTYAWIDHDKLVLAGQQELSKELPRAA